MASGTSASAKSRCPCRLATRCCCGSARSGVCGSDLHYYKEGAIGHARITQPFIAGHEFAGRVVEDQPATRAEGRATGGGRPGQALRRVRMVRIAGT
jgi:hypothetical protein